VRITLEVLRAIQRETVPASHWDRLSQLDLPMLILRGESEFGSLLSERAAERYREQLPNCQEQVLAGSGHDHDNRSLSDSIGHSTSFCRKSIGGTNGSGSLLWRYRPSHVRA
jgi:hypothetical protein